MAYRGDPAARSVAEVLVCYPGIHAMMHHRLAHSLHLLGVPFVARVISELGRNPRCNNFDGKDHWPFTSVMVSGSGVAGGRVIGGHSDQFEGLPVDFATGETTADGQLMSAGAVGGALLMLGDVDPGDWIDDAEPLTALLA